MNLRAVGWLSLMVVMGCGVTPPAGYPPGPGDSITPELFLLEPWVAGEKVQVTVRLQLEGKSHIQPAFVRFEDVPEEFAPTATIIFWDRCEIARHENVILTRDC